MDKSWQQNRGRVRRHNLGGWWPSSFWQYSSSAATSSSRSDPATGSRSSKEAPSSLWRGRHEVCGCDQARAVHPLPTGWRVASGSRCGFLNSRCSSAALSSPLHVARSFYGCASGRRGDNGGRWGCEATGRHCCGGEGATAGFTGNDEWRGRD
jgi:hypothetical protein